MKTYQMKEKGRKEAGGKATIGVAGGAARSPEVGGQQPRRRWCKGVCMKGRRSRFGLLEECWKHL